MQSDIQAEVSAFSGESFMLPASYAQQRMWVLDQLEDGGVAYNVPAVNRLRGALDVDALERVLTFLVARHESLRTVFTLVDGVPHQVVNPPAPVPLECIDLSATPDAEARGILLAEESARRGFDLGRGPLFRAQLIRLGHDDHILALNLHHAITDAWSMTVLGRELRELYSIAATGGPLEMPELPIQYGDYAVWQQQWVEEGGLDEQLAYWTTQLRGAPTLLELPTDRPRPATQSFRGETLRTLLPRELTRAVRELSQRAGTTNFMTLLAAFATLLSRYSGADDIVIGTPVANRGRVELESVIGLFVNTLALRVDLHGDPSFATLLERVRETSLEAFSNQELPFERLVGELAPERSRSHAPVTQVLFVVQAAAGEPPAPFEGLEQERLAADRGTAKFDLSLFAREVPEGLQVAIEYCTDLFDAQTVQRALGHFRTLLESAVTDPTRPISELELITASEREELGRFGAGPPAAPPDGRRVHDLVTEQARRTPDAVAVRFAEEELSYAELDARSSQLARHLQARGVGPDTVVAICADRGVETFVGVLGVLKAGGAYAPIDPAYPEDRVAFMLADSSAPVLLTQERLLARLPHGSAEIICLDADWAAIATQDTGDVPSATRPENLAYVLYTSGSTGRPKGVAMPHATLVNLIDWQRDSGASPSRSRTLQFASLSFDVAFQETFSTWSTGGTLILIEDDARRDPAALLQRLEEDRIERLFLPFVALQNLCDAAQDPARELVNLREVITAGEQLKATPAIRAFFTRHPHTTLFNHYGPTESHVVTALRLEGSPADWPELPSIGRPIAGATIRLLDAQGALVPVGVPGELCIGATLARGYLGSPELTAARFVGDGADRLYHTGDLARYRPDGQIEYLGRSDHQVKIRGYRVEPGEIEAILRAQRAITEALVVARPNPAGEQQLVAYVIADGTAPDATGLHEVLSRVLPEYMIPAAFVRLEAFPLSPNGKLDRAALPAPDDAARALDAYVAPRTHLETVLAEIFAALTGVQRVGVHDNFFFLGGHSLMAVQLVSRIRDRLDRELPLSAVFDSPTVVGLGQMLSREEGGHAAVSLRPPLVPAPRSRRRLPVTGDSEVTALPASFAQQRLWFLDRLEPNNPAYHIPMVVRLGGELHVDALERAITALVARHEALRTTFALIDGEPHQVIHDAGPVILARSDVENATDAEAEARRLVEREVRAPFDLSVGPLLRARLIRVDPRDHVLVLTMHHVVIDGWSVGVLNRELGEMYRAFSAGELPDLPELPIQYGDFAVWQQRWIQQGGLEDQLEYWKRQLAAAPTLLELPTDRPRPPHQSARGALVRTTVEPELLVALRSLGDVSGTTLFMTLLAGYVALLARYSGQDDIVVASPVANRGDIELEGLIGFFVNTLPLRVRVDDDPTVRDLLQRVRDTALAAFSRQDLPFEKLVEELNPDRHMSFAPLAQASFVLNAAEGPLQLADLAATRVTGERRTTKFDLGMYAAESPAGLALSIEYATDLFDEVTAQQMLDHYGNLLRALVSDPDRPMSALPMISAPERESALAGGAAAQPDFSVACLHELFEVRAAASPDTTAVVLGDDALTYGELNAAANQLAHRLIALGAAPETMVALVFEPSLELVIAVLAVLKAGAAYVPLDPEHPRDRLGFVLADTAAPFVVAQSHLVDRLPDHSVALLTVDPVADGLSDESRENPGVGVGPDNLAYVIYTSGSTGRPKGVQVEHRQVARLLSATDAWFSFGPSDTWSLLHSYAFDFSVWELWGALAYGGRLVISPKLTTRSPAALAALIAAEGVTVMNATPSLFLAVQEHLLGAADRLSLRTVIFGGEALSPPSLKPWFAHFGDTGPALVNMYGITETTVHVTYRPIGPSDVASSASPIGVPIADLSLYLLDRWGEPVPPGVVGELCVGGAGVTRGYLNRPDLNAERFITDPFGPGRLYRSGDGARRLPTGELAFCGRLDDQVKIRGFRIELGEIRAAIEAHPGVAEAAVVVNTDSSDDARLVAYLVAADPANPPSSGTLRESLARQLPAYMMPAAWLFLAELPLTANGKLDRQALPAPEYNRVGAGVEYVAPSTDIERRLARIWSVVLGVGTVGIDDNFFDLGGHSLLALAMFAQLEEEFDIPLPVSVLFRTGTIRALASEIHSGGAENDEPVVLQLQPQGRGTPLFCVCGVHVYQALANAFAPDVPVYGVFLPVEQEMLSPRTGQNRREAIATVEVMAAAYIAAIREEQPHGPYMLLGYSFGGIVAFEMCHQLEAAGEKVELVVLCDTILSAPYAGSQIGLPLRRAKSVLRHIRDQVKARHSSPVALSDELERLRTEVYAQARARYEPRLRTGPTVLIQAESAFSQPGRRVADPTFGWSQHVADLESHLVPGRHETLLVKPSAAIVAEQIRAHVDRVRADGGDQPLRRP